MKYKDNGQWVDVNIKALDSMPVGSIVDYDGQTSDIPAGWEQQDSWSLVDTKTGTSAITLPTDFNEIYIESDYNTSVSCAVIPKQAFTGARYFAGTGYYLSASDNKICTWYATTTSIKLNAHIFNGNDIKSGTTTKVYYK